MDFCFQRILIGFEWALIFSRILSPSFSLNSAKLLGVLTYINGLSDDSALSRLSFFMLLPLSFTTSTGAGLNLLFYGDWNA